MGFMDMTSPMAGFELRQAKERIEFLENELQQKNQGGGNLDIQGDTLEKLQKRNRELLERNLYLEKAQDLSSKNHNFTTKKSFDKSIFFLIYSHLNYFQKLLLAIMMTTFNIKTRLSN